MQPNQDNKSYSEEEIEKAVKPFICTSNYRENFRNYLISENVVEVLTTALSDLYMLENLPEDPIGFIQVFLSTHCTPKDDITNLNLALINKQKKIEDLLKQVEQLKQRLSKYEDC